MQQISIQHNHVKYYSEKHKPWRHLRDIHPFVGEEIGLREGNCLTQATQQISSRPSTRTQPPDPWGMQGTTRLPGSSRGPPLFTCPNFPSLAQVRSPCWPNNIILVLDIFFYFHHYHLPLNSFCLYLHLWFFINGCLFIFKSEALKCPFCECAECIGLLSFAVVSCLGVGQWKVPSNVLIYRYFLLGWLVR